MCLVGALDRLLRDHKSDSLHEQQQRVPKVVLARWIMLSSRISDVTFRLLTLLDIDGLLCLFVFLCGVRVVR